MKNMSSADYKIKRIVQGGYTVYSVDVPKSFRKRYIVAVKNDKSIFGTVAQVFRNLYGY